jgi:hypothetical protein
VSYRSPVITAPSIPPGHSIAGVDIGSEPAAGGHRMVTLLIGYRHASSTITAIKTATGFSFQRVVRRKPSGFGLTGEIWIGEVPTGTTAQLNFSGGALNDFTLAVLDVKTAFTVPIDDKSVASGGSPATISDLKIEKGGAVLVLALGSNANSFAPGWTGADSPTEHVEGDNGELHYAPSSFLTTESALDKDLSLTFSDLAGPTAVILAAVSVR